MDTITSELKLSQNKLDSYPDILTKEAVEFLTALHKNFNERRLELLANRQERQIFFDLGNFPTFLSETKDIRNSDWTADSIPDDLKDRRVEITGPVDRKMVINALNSGAKTFMADFEDSNSPTWNNNLQGQQNLRDAVNGTISFENNGKTYKLNEETAVLIVRPRGLHLNEKHIIIDKQEISGSLFDFGLYFFHNAHTLLSKQSGPYFYLPKLEHHLEARWWNDVFVFAQNYIGLPQATIKATVLIETITASFQLDEIIYELKNHIAGLNCGRWDYIFSYIKKFKKHPNFIVPDRSQVTMTSPFMAAYSQLVIQRCHKRNIHAIGGIGLRISKIGRNNAEATLNHPMRIPNTVPVIDPRRNPMSTRLKLHRICPSIVCVPIGCTIDTKKAVKVSAGPASTSPAFVNETTSCQIHRNTRIETAAQIVFT